MHTILDIFALKELKGQASEGAKHVGRHIQDPFGQTKDMFDDVHKKKMEYELAKQNLIHQTAPTRAVLDRVSNIHNLDQAPVSMGTEPLQPNPMDTQDGFSGNRTNDPLGTDPAMGQEVNQGRAGTQLDPASRVPQNMSQAPGQMNQNRPSKAGFSPGVSPGPAQSVVSKKMGMPQPGQSNVGQKAGNPSAPQFAPQAPKPKGAGQLPNAKGPGDPKVQKQVKKAQNNSSRGSGGESTAKQINIKIHGNRDCMKGARSNLDAMTGLDALRSCGKTEDEMNSSGTSEGAEKGWDSRGRGQKTTKDRYGTKWTEFPNTGKSDRDDDRPVKTKTTTDRYGTKWTEYRGMEARKKEKKEDMAALGGGDRMRPVGGPIGRSGGDFTRMPVGGPIGRRTI